MAIERRHVAVVTRSWGGDTGEGRYTAHRVVHPPTEGFFSVRIGNDFTTAGAAIRAANDSCGRMLQWERHDLYPSIESYNGYMAVYV